MASSSAAESPNLPPLVPPTEPDPADCCGSGCARCVWDVYYDNLADYDDAVEKRKKTAAAAAGVSSGAGEGGGVATSTSSAGTTVSESKGVSTTSGEVFNTMSSSALSSMMSPLERLMSAEATALMPKPKAMGSIVLRYVDSVSASVRADVVERKLSSTATMASPLSQLLRVVAVDGDTRGLRVKEAIRLLSSSTPSKEGEEGQTNNEVPVGDDDNALFKQEHDLFIDILNQKPPSATFLDCLLPAIDAKRRERLSAAVDSVAALSGGKEDNTAHHYMDWASLSASPSYAQQHQQQQSACEEELRSLQQEVRRARPMVSDYRPARGHHFYNSHHHAEGHGDHWFKVSKASFIPTGDAINLNDEHREEEATLPSLPSSLKSVSSPSYDCHSEGPLVPLRLDLTPTTATAHATTRPLTAADTLTDNSDTAFSPSPPIILPGDVVEVFVPNSDAMCVALLQRLKVASAFDSRGGVGGVGRRVTLLPSPFAQQPNSFPAWLAPAVIGLKAARENSLRLLQQQQQNQKLHDKATSNALANAITANIDGMLLEASKGEEKILDAIEEKREKEKEKASRAGAGQQQPSNIAANDESLLFHSLPPLPPSADIGSVSARTLLSIFKHYVDLSSSSYLRPAFFAMLCRVAEATAPPTNKSDTSGSVDKHFAPTDVQLLRFLSLSGTHFKTPPMSDNDKGAAATTDMNAASSLLSSSSPSSSSPSSSIGIDPHDLSALLNAFKPSMLAILQAFPAVTPQLPRLLEVCGPLRPRAFSVAGVQDDEGVDIGNVCGSNAMSVCGDEVHAVAAVKEEGMKRAGERGGENECPVRAKKNSDSTRRLAVDVFIRGYGLSSSNTSIKQQEQSPTIPSNPLPTPITTPTSSTAPAAVVEAVMAHATAVGKAFRAALETLFIENMTKCENTGQNGNATTTAENEQKDGEEVTTQKQKVTMTSSQQSAISFSSPPFAPSSFIGHASSRLVEMASQRELSSPPPSSSELSRTIMASSAADDAVWARVQTLRREEVSKTQVTQQQRGLFPSSSSSSSPSPQLPLDTPLILVSAGSGYAPLRAVLRGRLKAQRDQQLQEETLPPSSSPPPPPPSAASSLPPSSSPSQQQQRTIILCAVKTLEEASVIEGLIQHDIAHFFHPSSSSSSSSSVVGGGATTTESSFGSLAKAASKKRPRSSVAGDDASSVQAVDTSIGDIEDSVDAQQTSDFPIAKQFLLPQTKNSFAPFCIERHFFVSSLTTQHVIHSPLTSVFGRSQKRCGDDHPASSSKPMSFVHRGRLVDWFVARERYTATTAARALLPKPLALARFPSTHVSRLLFAAMMGSDAQPQFLKSKSRNQNGLACCESNIKGDTVVMQDDPTLVSFSEPTIAPKNTTAATTLINDGQCSGRFDSNSPLCAACPRRRRVGEGRTLSSPMAGLDANPTSDTCTTNSVDEASEGHYSYLTRQSSGGRGGGGGHGGAHLFACGPQPFLASVFKGMQHLLEWGPTVYEYGQHAQRPSSSSSEAPPALSDGADVVTTAVSSPPPPTFPQSSSSSTSLATIAPLPFDRPCEDQSEAEYEVRKLFLSNRIVFDYWE